MRIGELAVATDTPTSTLRYYERAGLLPPPARTGTGYRDYSREAADRVAFIRRAQAAGLTLAQIGEVLAIRDDGRTPCAHVAGLVDERLEDIDRRLDDLRRARDELRRVRRRLDDLEPSDCATSDICSAIGAAD
ncbi:MAG: heavy metal-responsive transcriptional regulator [Actinobacteria bacterium]|nr:heavy metal-responsive transcriptional regulator [Actinomycetota bacterium]